MPFGDTDVKQAIRERMLEIRRGLDPAWILASSNRIQKKVLALQPLVSAHIVGCYLALPREVQTLDLVEPCWKLGKKVCVPACDGPGGAYRLAWYEEGESTVLGPMNIRQPKNLRWVSEREVEFILVPGVAFDRTGRRLGHGGGHYDRLLAGCPAFKVGLAFEAQIIESLPAGADDVPVDIVITEETSYPLAG